MIVNPLIFSVLLILAAFPVVQPSVRATGQGNALVMSPTMFFNALRNFWSLREYTLIRWWFRYQIVAGDMHECWCPTGKSRRTITRTTGPSEPLGNYAESVHTKRLRDDMYGWIKLYRCIRYNPIFNDKDLFRLLIICLTEATHKPRKQIVGRQTIHLEFGQFVTGRFELAAMYNEGLKLVEKKSPMSVWRWLKALEKAEFVSIKSNSKFSVVTVLSWDKCHSVEHQDDQQMVTNKNKKNINTSRHQPKKMIYDENSMPLRLANYLLKKISEIKPDIKQPDIQKWADDMRKLVELDKRDPVQVQEVIDWVMSDAFWQVTILSAASLRKHWDQVTARMGRNGKKYKDTEKKAPQVDFRASEEEKNHAARVYERQ